MKNRESSQVTYLADSVSTVENKSRYTNQTAGDTMLPQDLSDSKGVICAISRYWTFSEQSSVLSPLSIPEGVSNEDRGQCFSQLMIDRIY